MVHAYVCTYIHINVRYTCTTRDEQKSAKGEEKRKEKTFMVRVRCIARPNKRFSCVEICMSLVNSLGNPVVRYMNTLSRDMETLADLSVFDIIFNHITNVKLYCDVYKIAY